MSIRVRNLSKAYKVATAAPRHTTMAEALMWRLRHPFRRERVEEFWALRGVEFDVADGQVVGVVGRNGAGKSTLLKLLSRIAQPTTGRIELYGRVGSLLEVGTGFHPELTGRENIYLNGAILGMRRSEVRSRFDEIVEFSGVERFLETPVKRYSSGMYVRLAFAVAAHLTTDILLVDEVLAVGDAQFQRRCLGKMRDVASSGRTVLFVSHNMAAVRSLCTRALVLRQGRVAFDGDVEGGLRAYAAENDRSDCAAWERQDAGDRALAIREVTAQLDGQQPDHVLNVRVGLQTLRRHPPAFVAVDILHASGAVVMQALPTVEGFISDDNTRHEIELAIQLPPLIPGDYTVAVWVGPHNTETLDFVNEAVGFEIAQSPVPGRTFPHSPDHGFIVPPARLTYRATEAAGAGLVEA
jgi:lipopolysaccharide transport system ATP-binding protein